MSSVVIPHLRIFSGVLKKSENWDPRVKFIHWLVSYDSRKIVHKIGSFITGNIVGTWSFASTLHIHFYHRWPHLVAVREHALRREGVEVEDQGAAEVPRQRPHQAVAARPLRAASLPARGPAEEAGQGEGRRWQRRLHSCSGCSSQVRELNTSNCSRNDPTGFARTCCGTFSYPGLIYRPRVQFLSSTKPKFWVHETLV